MTCLKCVRGHKEIRRKKTKVEIKRAGEKIT